MNKYFKVLSNREEYNPYYEVYLNWDSNDADYISRTETFQKEYFEEDETLQLVLCYIGNGYSGKLFNGKRSTSQYGRHIDETRITGLKDFIVENNLASYSEYGMCHSVDSVVITYYDEHRVAHDVELTDFDTLYSTKEEAIKDLEDKIEKWFKAWNNEEKSDNC